MRAIPSLSYFQGSVLDAVVGLARVMEVQHTLILGWSDKTVPTILELANSFESDGGGVIVILAENGKQDMEEEVSERCPKELMQGSQVVCRSGFPIRVEDLKRVSATTGNVVCAPCLSGSFKPDPAGHGTQPRPSPNVTGARTLENPPELWGIATRTVFTDREL